MLLASRNILLLPVVLLLVLLFCTFQLPFEAISARLAPFNSNVLPLLREVLSERLPYRIWSPSATTSPAVGKTGGAEDGLQRHDSRTKFTRHIVAVGDLHGDMPNARRVLQFSGVTDDNGDWSGNVDFFVQTGDIIDRYVLLLSKPN